jgi:hypothetical protein
VALAQLFPAFFETVLSANIREDLLASMPKRVPTGAPCPAVDPPMLTPKAAGISKQRNRCALPCIPFEHVHGCPVLYTHLCFLLTARVFGRATKAAESASLPRARKVELLPGVRRIEWDSADFPRAVCRRKALEGERGPTPLHPGGPPLGGPTSSASLTRRLQVCRIATPSPIPSPSSHPSLSHPAPRSMRERGSRDSPAFRRHVRPVRLHLLRHLRRFMILASLFVVVRRLPCRLPCAFRLPCCLVFACASGVARDRDPSCASSAPQRYPFSRV